MSKTLSLSEAVNKGLIEEVRTWTNFGADINGKGVLLFAVVFPRNTISENMVKILLDAGANIDEIYHEYTALMYAAENSTRGRQKIARILLDYGADVNTEDLDGYTALMGVAADTCSASTVHTLRMLLEAGGDANQTANVGWTSLDYAVGFVGLYGDTRAITMLVESVY